MIALAMYSYKQYERNSRLQNVEDLFNKGMQVTNTPLQEGWVRALINYDVTNEGESLVPRPGLQASQLFIPEDTSGDVTIVAAKEQALTSTENRMQLLTIEKLGELGYNLRVVTGGTTPVEHAFADNELHDSVAWYNYKVSDPILVSCTIPDKAEIHGIPIDNETLAKHPGVYAWNENYYFFDEHNNKVVHTEWDEDTDQFIFKSDDPKAVSAKEAVTYGYNMLLEQPYSFSNNAGAPGSIIQFEGMMPYDPEGNLCLTPVTNQSLDFEVFYNVPLDMKYYILIEWKNMASSVWEKLKEFDTTFTEAGTIKFPFSPPDENLIIRVSAFGYEADTRKPFVDATLAVGFNFNRESYGTTANVAPKTYTVNKATGVTYWKNRLVAYGVPEDQRILFVSDINDPTYFPYPDNVDTFDEPIKYVEPFLDNLLVFTSTKLYLLALDETALSWTKKCIQTNLTIAAWDIHLIQVVKNMVFFRSGNYYYMVVPKAGSMTGELTLAAISKPVYYMFDKFAEMVQTTLKEVYGYADTALVLKQYYNYLDFEDVHNVYVFQTEESELINFDVLYNTITRSWRVHVNGSIGLLLPYKQDMTRKGLLCNAAVQNTDKVVYQLLQYNNVSNQDYYNVDYTNPNPVELFDATHIWRNWQGIDTGYREHSSNFKKRYREMQFVINNRSNRKLKFFTDFFIDGEQRRSKYRYNVVHNLDPSSSKYGELVIEQTFNEPLIAPGATSLGTDYADSEAWELDTASFPDTSFWKARFPVSGKGYAPRMTLVSRNELPYELLNISWIYREMNSR